MFVRLGRVGTFKGAEVTTVGIVLRRTRAFTSFTLVEWLYRWVFVV